MNPIYHIVAYHIWNANINYPIFFLLFCKWFLKLYLKHVTNSKKYVNWLTFQQMCSFCALIIFKSSFLAAWCGHAALRYQGIFQIKNKKKETTSRHQGGFSYFHRIPRLAGPFVSLEQTWKWVLGSNGLMCCFITTTHQLEN